MDQDIFKTDRPLLFSIAYRMLGSASDAEDVLQDAWVRWNGADRAAIRSPKAFATTIITRLCLDRLKSARASREEYIGPWLPEPVLTSEVEGPDTMLQRAESVTLAFLVLLEKLSPEERRRAVSRIAGYEAINRARSAKHALSTYLREKLFEQVPDAKAAETTAVTFDAWTLDWWALFWRRRALPGLRRRPISRFPATTARIRTSGSSGGTSLAGSFPIPGKRLAFR